MIKSLLMQSVILSRTVKMITYFSPITLIIFVSAVGFFIIYNKRRARMVKLINKIPGPPALPIIGNTVEINVDHDELFARITGTRFLWGRRFGISRAWMGSLPYVFISDASKVEIILGSPKHIDKSRDYNFLRPWLGTGLLTSFGQKWHSRRKILTPAFHFKILEDFIDVFQEQSDILVRKIEKEVGKNSFNIFPYITNCTLDIICETAMGRSVYAQEDSDSEYVKAVYDIGEIILNRQSKLWLQYDFIFKCTNYYKQHQIALKILHDFSYRVIRERKAEIKKLKMDLNNNHIDGMIDQNNNNIDINKNPNNNNNPNNNGNNNYNNHYDNNNDNNNTNSNSNYKNNYDNNNNSDRDSDSNNDNNNNNSNNNNIKYNYVGDNNFNQNIQKKYIVQRNNHYDDEVVFGKKKRLAFLDLLIEASRDGEVLSNEDIREEVDTFMFEGHDTTSAAISWSLFLLGSHPEIQDRVLQEIDDILDGDRTRPATMKELMDMKYLECVIKEALRLYPSVPLIARQINEDVNIGQYTLPAGTTAMIVTYQLHRDPKVFPKPEQFNPDHFLPENCYGRHPYAYIPFSAGPRNCIGQKFAILEEKSVISTVLRKYRIVSVDRREDLTLLGELILRPKDGLQVKIIPRD